MPSLQHWFLAARPKTLLAAVAPVATGTALASTAGQLHLPAAAAALAGAISIQIGTNFCNDYFDFFQGADTDARKGPARAVQAGLITPRQMLAATMVMFAITGLICIYLVSRAGWPLLLIGTLSIASGILYTASRYSLAYLGLGDLFVLVFFGPVAVGGTYYVQALRLPPWILVAGLAPGLLSVGLLVVNNLRDIDEDRRADKRTLAVRFGPLFSRLEYAACIGLAASIPLWLYWQRHVPVAALMGSIIILPGAWIIRQIWVTHGRALNAFLGRTAGLLLLYTLLFCTGCLIG